MTEWRNLRIRDVMAEFHDGPHATPSPTDEGPIYLGIKNISDAGAIDLSEVRHIAEEDFARWTRRVCPQPGDLVFTYEATLHRYALIPTGFRGCLGRRLALIRPDREVVLPRFLHQLMLGPAWRATVTDRIVSGATVDRIPIIDFPNFPIAVPDLATQHAVVEILGAIDDLIENNARRIELMEMTAQATYNEWFVRIRYPGHQGGPTSTPPLERLPSSWEVSRAGDLIKAGLLEIGDGYRAKNSEMLESGVGIPFVRIANVRDGYLRLSECDQLPLDYRERLGAKVSRAGDSLVSTKGTVGRCAYIDHRYPSVAYSPQVSYWRSMDVIGLPPSYIHFWLRSEYFTLQCAAVKGATDMADYVNLKDQRHMMMLRPTDEVIRRFDELAGGVLTAVGALRFQADRLAAMRDLLLPRLVTGQIDVSGLRRDAAVEYVA
jgi:type I restriction enzyme S subunit